MTDPFEKVNFHPDMSFEELKENLYSLEQQIANEAYLDLDGDGRLDSVVQRWDSDGDGIPDRMRILADGVDPVVQRYDPVMWEQGVTASEAAERPPHLSAQVRFGAGTCSYCGGYGTSVYTDGRREKCWHCSGTGVAP